MVMIQSSTAATAIFIATIFISSLVTISAFAQAQSMNQSMDNAGDSANQTSKYESSNQTRLKRDATNANQTGEAIQRNASDFGSNISEGAKELGTNITEGVKNLAENYWRKTTRFSKVIILFFTNS